MRRRFAQAGIGVLALTGPALAATPQADPAQARAIMLRQVQAQLAAEQHVAQEVAGRLAAFAATLRHARTARAE